MIGDPTDLHEAPLFSSDYATEIRVQPVPDLRGDQRNPLFRAEHDVIDELRVGPRHRLSPSSGFVRTRVVR
jgi:hypothetical protein